MKRPLVISAVGAYRPITILCTLLATLLSIVTITLDGIDRIRAIGSLAVLTATLALLTCVRGTPSLPVFSSPHAEHLLPGKEEGCIVASGLLGTVDSGATSTAISEYRQDLLTEVTNDSPNQKIWIADDNGLEIVKIGEMDLKTSGYKLIRQPGVSPKGWTEEPCKATLFSSRTLVVRGLGRDTILFSVRGLKRDGVKTFLNCDNSIEREDCLLLPDGVTVIPFANTHAYQIPLEHAAVATDATPATTITSRRSNRVPALVHQALGHGGNRRLKASNIIMDRVKLTSLDHDTTSCPGCRLGNTGKSLAKHKRWKQAPSGSSREGYSHFGQQMDTDMCTGFKPSFPHHFTGMINFNDRYSTEKWLYFVHGGDSNEVCSSLVHLHDKVEHRLRDGKIGRWVTDNGKSFLGQDTEDVARELFRNRGYGIPNDSDSLPVPERNWGVLQRMMRSMHAGATDTSDPSGTGAPECLWTWSAQQSCLLHYYLSSAVFDPPMSPYQFVTKDTSPVDLSWARTMFCDATVTLPDRDIGGKVTAHSADGCHFGYDPRRGAHFVYVECIQRLSTYTVKEWREHSFTLCKRISADSPVEYFEAHDLPFSSATGKLIPHRYTARARKELGAQLRTGSRILVLFHRERSLSVMEFLRVMGNSVESCDIRNSIKQDLSVVPTQYRVLDAIPTFDFVFICPPCQSANIAFDPALRTFPDFTRGVNGLSTKHQKLVDDHNLLFDFTAEVMARCDESQTDWGVESCASRRRNNAADWPRYHRNAFIWDYPPLARHFSNTTARVRTCAQCRFTAPWQKYTDLGSSGGANDSFDRIFQGADCICDRPHEVRLQGYDTHGVALTAVAAEYKPGFASVIAHAISDTCSSRREGGNEDDWSLSLSQLSRTELDSEIALSLLQPEDPDGPVTHGLTRPEIAELHSKAHRENLDVSPDIEIWLSDAEGAFTLDEYERKHSILKVSEIGSELSKIKMIDQAKQSKHWPLFKAAMEEEIKGKMENAAWEVVPRPVGVTVHKSRWVFAIKLNDDNSIKTVKCRFVGCGYSQVEGRDYDYDSVFAATLPGVSFRMLLCWICDEDLDTDHIDAVKAFTQARIDKQTYVNSPEGFTVDNLTPMESLYCLLLYMALEGVKQGANLWFGLNKAAWLKLGCKSWLNETNLYYHEGIRLRVGVFADDTLCGYPADNRAQYLMMKKEYGKIIKIGSSVLKFTGVQIDRDRPRRLITIHQTRYLDQMEEGLKAQGIVLKQWDTPHGVSKEDRSAFDKVLEDKSSPSSSRITFLQLMGKLVWPSCMTRPDVSMEISTLCSCVSDPRESHYKWALVVAGYLCSHKSLGITYGGKLRIPYGLSQSPHGFNQSSGMYTAHDSSWGTRARPLGGYVIMYLNGAVDWSAKLVKIVPDSSCEAETAVASVAAKGTCFIRALCNFHHRPVAASTPTLGDNQAYHSLVVNEGATTRTRYYERATLLIKRAVLMLILQPMLVSTHYMIADIFTKALEKSSYVRFRNTIMNSHSSLRDSLQLATHTVHGEARRLVDRLLAQM